jgi:hypothetical protein
LGNVHARYQTGCIDFYSRLAHDPSHTKLNSFVKAQLK